MVDRWVIVMVGYLADADCLAALQPKQSVSATSVDPVNHKHHMQASRTVDYYCDVWLHCRAGNEVFVGGLAAADIPAELTGPAAKL